MTIGLPGERYVVAQNLDGKKTRYLAGGTVEDFVREYVKLPWVGVVGVAKPFTYSDAAHIARLLPNAFVVRAVVAPPPQTEFSLW